MTTGDGAADRSALGQFRRNMKVAEQYRRFRPDGYPGMVTRVVYDAYYMTHTRKYSPSCKQEIQEQFAEWCLENGEDFGRVEEKALRKIRMISRSELTEPDEEIEDDLYTVKGWMEGLK